MGFTDVEMAILSQASYCDGPSRWDTPMSLYDFLNTDAVTSELKSLGDGYADAIESLKNKVEGKDYYVVDSINDRHGSGFAAFAVSDPDNCVTVACRGTEGFSMDYDSRKDVMTDASLLLSLRTDQHKVLEQFMNELNSIDDYDGFYFTGHSLGGNIATYGAIKLVDPDKLKGCITFNAPGFNDAFILANAKAIYARESKIISYQNECDPVSSLLTVPGKKIVLEYSGDKGQGCLDFSGHLLKKLVIRGDTFERNKTNTKLPNVFTLLFISLQARFSKPIFIYNAILYALSLRPGVDIGLDKRERISDYVSRNPSFGLDTAKMKAYAERLAAAHKKQQDLMNQLSKLHLDPFLKMRAWIGGSNRLSESAFYLRTVANRFEKITRQIVDSK